MYVVVALGLPRSPIVCMYVCKSSQGLLGSQKGLKLTLGVDVVGALGLPRSPYVCKSSQGVLGLPKGAPKSL